MLQGDEFQKLVKSQVAQYASKGKKPITSFHEAYGLILEELDEFWDEVKKKPSLRDKKNALKELVQIAALVQSAAIDLNLVTSTD